MKNITILLLLIIISLPLYSTTTPKWESILYRDNCWSITTCVVDSLDAYTLIDTGYFIEIMKSTTGGETWETIYTEEDLDGDSISNFPKPRDAYEMFSPAKNHLYVCYDLGQIRHSRDGGYTYDTLSVNSDDGDGNLSMIDTLNGIYSDLMYTDEDKYGYAFTNILLRTEDNWTTFDTIRIDTILEAAVGIYDLHMFTKEHFIVASCRANYGFRIYSTKDAGKSWNYFDMASLINGEDNCIPRVFYFHPDNRTGWIAASEKNYIGDQRIDVIFKTTDAGDTWELNYKQENEPIFGLRSIAFKNYQEGIATGPWGKILRTTDGGETWVQEWSQHHDSILDHYPHLEVDYFGSKPIITTAGFGHLVWREMDPNSVFAASRPDFKVYPNPAQAGTNLNISISDIPEFKQLVYKLYSINGQIVFSTSQNSFERFLKLPDDINYGTYVLMIEEDGFIIGAEKIVIE